MKLSKLFDYTEFKWLTKKQYIFLSFSLLFSFLIPLTLGMNYALYGVLGNFLLLLCLKFMHRWLFVVGVFILTLTCSLFLPTKLWYGDLNQMMVFSVLETNISETKEFFQSFSWYVYALSLLVFLFGIFLCYFSLKIKFSSKYKAYIFMGLILTTSFITLYKPYKNKIQNGKFEMKKSRTSAISFYVNVYHFAKDYYNFMQEVKQQIQEESSWQIEKVQPKYGTYVLVIGESARADYMSAYGYPHQNTPFMQTANGYVLEGYTSAGFNTIASLNRTLKQVKSNGEIEHKNNIVSLAKKAGFKVYWFSNQGKIGEYDTQASLIAVNSDVHKFTKIGHFDSFKTYDSALIDFFKEAIKNQDSQPQLFVLHLSGSHPKFKHRLENPLKWNVVNEEISAYIQTIEQTDDFLKEIYQLLKNQKETFSMLYFSDHGLGTKNRNSRSVTLAHDVTQGGCRVPFFITSSDDSIHQNIKVNKSGFNFLFGFSSWLGIEEKSLKNYDFLSLEQDSLKVFNGKENVLYDSLQEDEPVK